MVAFERLEIPNSLGKLEYVLSIKRNFKNTKCCMSSNKFFLKYGLQEKHWFGHSGMKPVVAVVFQKRKEIG